MCIGVQACPHGHAVLSRRSAVRERLGVLGVHGERGRAPQAHLRVLELRVRARAVHPCAAPRGPAARAGAEQFGPRVQLCRCTRACCGSRPLRAPRVRSAASSSSTYCSTRASCPPTSPRTRSPPAPCTAWPCRSRRPLSRRRRTSARAPSTSGRAHADGVRPRCARTSAPWATARASRR